MSDMDVTHRALARSFIKRHDVEVTLNSGIAYIGRVAVLDEVRGRVSLRSDMFEHVIDLSQVAAVSTSLDDLNDMSQDEPFRGFGPAKKVGMENVVRSLNPEGDRDGDDDDADRDSGTQP